VQPAIPRRSAGAAPTMKTALLLYGVLLAISAVGLGSTRRGESRALRTFFVLESAQAVVIVAFLVQTPAAPGRVPRAQHWGEALLFACVTALAAWANVDAVQRLLGEARTSLPAGLASARTIDLVLVMAVAPALLEETAFRGILFSAFAPVVGVRTTIAITALLFTVLHLSIAKVPFLLLMGALLGHLRARSGSLGPPMLMHFVHNCCAIALRA
jgi:membrane protease YdiL (CAAX protease family)